ncbi:regulator of ribonuclease activity A [Hydrocarboniphaga daqingensis]|jgi:regulator of ribonuclease activity A|uniref:4-hydroxy-4-methyl-2-oxoglutarate aldolase n=1 Tax=Hydrocarboniphaga daqingensis TaxID=490188 RepID=A0A1M5RRQ2_9GAMM|nr:ribonuclease E activity regulator RraA [Hydrocarboniphaga daqingensis]SHH28870.1 regulator of ribonuclease activity A [Hydrocarboniphaga daqingensis]
MSYATTDLSDAHPDAPVCAPIFRDFGGKLAFHGPIKTLKVFEDNASVRATLETPGEGRVLVVDGGGSDRCALVGGNLGVLAVKNGWSGIVVYGYIRDSAEIATQAVGVKALGLHPRKSEKGLHSAVADKVVTFAGVHFHPGHWLYADRDGIVVSDKPLHA